MLLLMGAKRVILGWMWWWWYSALVDVAERKWGVSALQLLHHALSAAFQFYPHAWDSCLCLIFRSHRCLWLIYQWHSYVRYPLIPEGGVIPFPLCTTYQIQSWVMMTAGPGNKSYVFDWMSCDKADVDVFCVIIGKGDKTCQVYYGISSALWIWIVHHWMQATFSNVLLKAPYDALIVLLKEKKGSIRLLLHCQSYSSRL